VAEIVEHPRMREQQEFVKRLDALLAEFKEFCAEFRPETVIDERTADLAAVFAAYKLDNGEDWKVA
jgi:hypothetical protein